MELVELTKENIQKYLDTCIKVQKCLVREHESMEAEQFIATAAATHNYFVGLVEEGRIIGLGVVNKIVHPARTDAYLDNIVIDPAHRGQGLFNVIMDALEGKAKEWGAAGVKLSCSRSEVQPLYEKRGYVEHTTTNYYLKQF